MTLPLRVPARVSAALLAACCLPAIAANHDTIVPSLGAGPFRIACSNVAQDAALIAQSGSNATDFWEGRPNNGQLRYLTQVLTAPGTALTLDVAVPPTPGLYPQFAGQAVPHAAIVCHPTPASNTDPDYVLPGTGDRVPRMQPAGAAPKLIGAAEYDETLGLRGEGKSGPARLPLLVFSHGLGGSPISPGYLEAMTDLASFGFVVGAVFHGDPRFSRVRLEDVGDVIFLFTNFDRFVEMELMRPLSLTALTDRLLVHPGFAPGIRADAIGAFGASMGGQAVANLLGAKLTTSLGGACRETARDPRIKAAVGLVPYSGQTFLPSFCDDQSGAEEVSRPYLAIAGTADSTAPIKMTEQALQRFRGTRYLLGLEGVPHEYTPDMRGDVMTWTVAFLTAYVGGPLATPVTARDVAARTDLAKLLRMAGVSGGPAEDLRLDIHLPEAPGTGGAPLFEFHHDRTDRYYLAPGEERAAQVDAGADGPGWNRTGHVIKAKSLAKAPRGMPGLAPTPAVPACAFRFVHADGPASWFFSTKPAECESVKGQPGWREEGTAFHTVPVDAAGRCPPGFLVVQRAYNNGAGAGAPNHRLTSSDSTLREMVRRGWTDEGPAMCALP
jgi:hypothetical protein